MNLLIHFIRQAIIFYLAWKLGGMMAQAYRETKPTCEHLFCQRFHWTTHALLFLTGISAVLFLGFYSLRVINFYFPL